jgi:LysR family glycine cleavage system transcriptional activator
MCRRLLLLNALRAFEVAARHKSLAKAAEELAVTPAAIHHQIKSLEESLGVDLFTRSGNNLSLTRAADAVLPNLQGAFDLLSLVTEQLKQHASEGVLSIATSPAFSQKWLIPRLARFKTDFPHIDLRISTIGALPDLFTTELDVAVCYSSLDDLRQSGVALEMLLEDEVYPVCSLDFQARHQLRRESDLLPSHILHDNELAAEQKVGWAQWFPAGTRLRNSEVLQFDSTTLAIEAAISGHGVVLAPHSLVAHDIAAGRLLRLFSRSLPVRGGYYVAHLETVAEQPMVVAFREWLFAEASVNRAQMDKVTNLAARKRSLA